MDSLKDQIKKARKLKEASLKTYVAALKKIRSGMNDPGPFENAEFLKDFDKVMKAIHKESKLTSKKNKMTAVLVALGAQTPPDTALIEKYSTALKQMNDEYFSFLRQQKKTPAQKKNWISYKRLLNVVNSVHLRVKDYGIPKKDELTRREFDTLQQYLILRTYMTFPLRNDFADMPIVTHTEFNEMDDDEKKRLNYLVLLKSGRKEFHINQYKNSRFLGSKVLKVPTALNRVINLWLKHNKSGFYLVKSTDRETPMTPNHITKLLNRIFHKYADGKRISTSMIRHIVISHMLEGQKTLAEKEKESKAIEDKFFHSAEVNQLYRKVDDDIDAAADADEEKKED